MLCDSMKSTDTSIRTSSSKEDKIILNSVLAEACSPVLVWWTQSPAFKVNNRNIKYKQWSYETGVTEMRRFMRVSEDDWSSGEIQLKTCHF